MKVTILFSSLLLGYAGLMVDRTRTPRKERPLEELLRLHPEQFHDKLSDKDWLELSRVNKSLHQSTKPEFEKRLDELALWQSYVLNAKDLNLSNVMKHFFTNKRFTEYIIKSLKDFNTNNPGHWVNLNLSNNNLGQGADYHSEFFISELMDAITSTIRELGINIASLDLSQNNLTNLPPTLFAGLNLQKLDLSNNVLPTLPVGLFAGIYNLETLLINQSQLNTLPVGLFTDLNNLQELNLSSNQLTSLPPTLLNGLHNLKKLDLSENELTSLPPTLFAGLDNLQQLYLFSHRSLRALQLSGDCLQILKT